jgi:iron complex transport system ATP-binding protein
VTVAPSAGASDRRSSKAPNVFGLRSGPAPALYVALAQEAPVLMADEPTAHLDLGAAAAMARLLRGLAGDGLGVVLVVHDLALAAAVADRVVVLAEGRSVASGPPADVLDAERLAAVWRVDAALQADEKGRTALRVDWLGGS